MGMAASIGLLDSGQASILRPIGCGAFAAACQASDGHNTDRSPTPSRSVWNLHAMYVSHFSCRADIDRVCLAPWRFTQTYERQLMVPSRCNHNELSLRKLI